MKKYFVIGLIVLLICLVSLEIGYQRASANFNNRVGLIGDARDLAAPTLLPTTAPVIEGGTPAPTVEPRVLPAVGSNAGLVIGASVLVLIIIGGVLSARLRSKH